MNGPLKSPWLISAGEPYMNVQHTHNIADPGHTHAVNVQHTHNIADPGHTHAGTRPPNWVLSTALNHPAYTAEVQELVDLWLQRYGHDWVQQADVALDEFFCHAMARLRSLGRLEEVFLQDLGYKVVRLPE